MKMKNEECRQQRQKCCVITDDKCIQLQEMSFFWVWKQIFSATIMPLMTIAPVPNVWSTGLSSLLINNFYSLHRRQELTIATVSWNNWSCYILNNLGNELNCFSLIMLKWILPNFSGCHKYSPDYWVTFLSLIPFPWVITIPWMI